MCQYLQLETNRFIMQKIDLSFLHMKRNQDRELRSFIHREWLTISSNAAKQSFGQVLDNAQREPVMIHKHNRSAAAILSIAVRGANLR